MSASEESLPNNFLKTEKNQEMNKINQPNLNDFVMLKVIGRGTYGKVQLVRHITSKNIYAMKVLKKQKIKKLKQCDRTKTEMVVQSNLTHPFIVKLLYAFQTTKSLQLVMEQCPGGELFQQLQVNGQMNESHVKFYVAQIILVIEYLHSKDILQRDLKPENVLVANDGQIKKTDFGFCKEGAVSPRSAFSFCGTPEYLAPEIINRQGHGKAVDWWSVGAFTQELLTGSPPFRAANKKDLYERIDKCTLNQPPYLSQQAVEFLKSLFVINPELRLGSVNGATDLKQCKWFEGLNWEALLEKSQISPWQPQLRTNEDVRQFDKVFTEELVKQSAEQDNEDETFGDFEQNSNSSDEDKNLKYHSTITNRENNNNNEIMAN